MTRLSMKLAALGLAATAAAGCMAAATPSSAGMSQAEEGTRCEIRVTERGSMLLLEALVHADETLSGRATFAIDGVGSAGSTRIHQSTSFSASPDAPAVLGQTMVMAGAQYDVSIDGNAGSTTLSCSERVGGAI